MAKEVKITNEETLTKLEKAELWIKDNQKAITICCCTTVAVIALGLLYYFFLFLPKKQEAAAKLAAAVTAVEAGDYQGALYGNEQFEGLEQVISKYGSKNGSAAYLYAAAAALKVVPADADAALEYLAKFKTKDNLLKARATALKGDALCCKGELEQAIACYEQAAEVAGGLNGVEYTFKAGNTYEILGQNDKALETYKSIKEQFPTDITADNSTNIYIGEISRNEFVMTIDKYISRLEVK